MPQDIPAQGWCQIPLAWQGTCRAWQEAPWVSLAEAAQSSMREGRDNGWGLRPASLSPPLLTLCGWGLGGREIFQLGLSVNAQETSSPSASTSSRRISNWPMGQSRCQDRLPDRL